MMDIVHNGTNYSYLAAYPYTNLTAAKARARRLSIKYPDQLIRLQRDVELCFLVYQVLIYCKSLPVNPRAVAA